MAAKRKSRTAAFKAQVALAAHKGDRTVNELAAHYGVHPTPIHAWRRQLVQGAEEIFGSPAEPALADAEARRDTARPLYGVVPYSDQDDGLGNVG